MSVAPDTITQKNRHVATVIFAVAAGMVGLAYASVPLYDLFCRVTGFGGTTQISEVAPGAATGAVMREVRFNRRIDTELDWGVQTPDLAAVIPGEEVRVNYIATNTTDAPITGTSSFNVTPEKVGQYFMKIECFCFTEQTLKPGERVEMPVVFYLDPEIDEDINTRTTPEITLSYTFYPVDTDGNAG
jgi:cytochrome c oxidase assembly protein subunit 11